MSLDIKQFGNDFIQALQARTGEPVVTDQDMLEAQYALTSCWELVKYHGLSTWTLESMPSIAQQVLVEAAARLYMNLSGFVSERADTVSFERLEQYAGGASLTEQEISRLEDVAGKAAHKGRLISSPLVNTDAPAFRSDRGPVKFVKPLGPYYSEHQIPIAYMPGFEAGLAPYDYPYGGW